MRTPYPPASLVASVGTSVARWLGGSSNRSVQPMRRWATGWRLHGRRIAFGEPALVPVRVWQRHLAGGVEPRHLIARQVPADGAQVLPQLFFVARADDERGNRGPLEQPVRRALRHGLGGLGG